jgi:hypothetical protein
VFSKSSKDDHHDQIITKLLRSLPHSGDLLPETLGPQRPRVINSDPSNFLIETHTQRLTGNLYDGKIYHFLLWPLPVTPQSRYKFGVLYSSASVRFQHDSDDYHFPLRSSFIQSARILTVKDDLYGWDCCGVGV